MAPHIRLGLVLVCIMLVTGCATPGGSWSSVNDGARVAEIGRLRLEMPNGWMRLSDQDLNHVVLSRDGVNLQKIEAIHAKSEDAFPKLKRGAPSDALASELAELQLAEIRANSGTENAEVVKNEPANIAGAGGYKLHIRFKNPRGLRYERIVYGFTTSDGYYTLTYEAPTLYYFARDRVEFDALIGSLQVNGRAKLN